MQDITTPVVFSKYTWEIQSLQTENQISLKISLIILAYYEQYLKPNDKTSDLTEWDLLMQIVQG